MANRQRATFGNIIKEVGRSPGRKFRLYMYGLIMSSVLTFAFLKARDARMGERNTTMLVELHSSLFLSDIQLTSSLNEPMIDTGYQNIADEILALEYLETFGWPMEDYGVEVPNDCHVPPDFNQPELQEVCIRHDVPRSECEQFLKFAWSIGAADIHPALGYRPGCLD